ncbi:MAG: class I SAM-dependent methyltransferase [Candidatus Solibacter usitatus]|nr:class I SAM-dependent methyltransferase [Candidatus Solibacter usitatus]
MTRDRMRQIAREHIARGDSLGWFEAVYREARSTADAPPWANRKPNVNLTAWLERNPNPQGTACVVGCGFGDDAAELARIGLNVTAFDISPTAIEVCTERFPHLSIHWEAHDLFSLPAAWENSFDFVFEANTLQVLPRVLRGGAFSAVINLVKPGGSLLVIARARDEQEPEGDTPWPLTRAELQSPDGFRTIMLEDFLDDETPPVRRFRALYLRNPHSPV